MRTPIENYNDVKHLNHQCYENSKNWMENFKYIFNEENYSHGLFAHEEGFIVCEIWAKYNENLNNKSLCVYFDENPQINYAKIWGNRGTYTLEEGQLILEEELEELLEWLKT